MRRLVELGAGAILCVEFELQLLLREVFTDWFEAGGLQRAAQRIGLHLEH